MPSKAMPRLAHLGVPTAFHALIAARRVPRFHTLRHLSVVLASIAAAAVAIVAWSRYVATAATATANAAHALLYDSDIGAESLGLIFTVLLAAGWLCGAMAWQRGSEVARDGWATDLKHEPAKYKAITDWLWRQMIRRHTREALSADDFLDRLGAGVVRDLRHAALAMLALTAVLGAAQPAVITYATETGIVDHKVLPLAWDAVRPIAGAVAVVAGCPTLPKEGSTLIYRLRFSGGAEANLGAWRPASGSRVAALEAIAARLPVGTPLERFANPIGSTALVADCLKAFGLETGADGIARLSRLLALSDAEKKILWGARP